MGATTYTGINCVGCGGPLEPPSSGNKVTCSYCGRVLVVESDQTRQTDAVQVRDITDQLLRGYNGRDYGNARRRPAPEFEDADWKCWERGVWPVSSLASSSFGVGWNHAAIVGAPRVFPRFGDIPGAWAPGTRNSHVEWVEAIFPTETPDIEAIRVFETCTPGASFAVTVRDGDREELVWQGRPGLQGSVANILEVAVDPPRPVHGVRVYVNNDIGSRWSEIDTICLVATESIPLEMRRRPPKIKPMTKVWLALALIAAAVVFFSVRSYGSSAAPAATPRLGVPETWVEGGQMKVWTTDVAGMSKARTVWATKLNGVSSQYGSTGWSGHRALGRPDTFPEHGDRRTAWAPLRKTGGAEWITVEFPEVVNAGSVIIVETFNPGAVVRIDDLSNATKPLVLWQGTTQPRTRSRILSLELAAPQAITKIRIVLDTRRVRGWNEIDAIGLVPRRD